MSNYIQHSQKCLYCGDWLLQGEEIIKMRNSHIDVHSECCPPYMDDDDISHQVESKKTKKEILAEFPRKKRHQLARDFLKSKEGEAAFMVYLDSRGVFDKESKIST